MRARLPLAVALAPFAGLAVAGLAGRVAARGPVLAGLALAAPAVFWPVLDADARERDLAERDFNHAVYLLERPDGLAEAERVALELEARWPNTSRLQTLLAEVEARRGFAARADGRGDEAKAALQRALARLEVVLEARGVDARERFRAWRLAGWIQLGVGFHEQAVRSLTEARAFDPDDPRLRRELAEALLGRADELAAADPAGAAAREAEARALLRGLADGGDAAAGARLAELGGE